MTRVHVYLSGGPRDGEHLALPVGRKSTDLPPAISFDDGAFGGCYTYRRSTGVADGLPVYRFVDG
jgi:hypothetical protein